MNTLWFYERPHPRGGDAEESWIHIPDYKGVEFWDYAVDGEWLYLTLARAEGISEDDAYWGWVSPFDVGSRADQLTNVDALAGVAPTNHDYGRHCLSVCSNCSDRYCGGMTASVEFRGNEVVWRDFAEEYFVGWDRATDTEWSRGDAPALPVEFHFGARQYREALADLRRRIEATAFPWDEAGT